MVNDTYDRFTWQDGEVEVIEPGQRPTPDVEASDIVWSPGDDGELEGQKFNPNHDRLGRFSSGSGVAGALTPFDTPAIVSMREEVKGLKSTHEINTAERGKLRQDLMKHLDANNGVFAPKAEDRYTIERGKVADLVLGPPAAGKSSFADPLRRQRKSRLLDSDEVKQGLPEFRNGRHAGAVHEESDMLMYGVRGRGGMLNRSLARGENVVMPLVGGTPRKIEMLGRYLKSHGYTVNLHYVDLPARKAAQRAVQRQTSTGRFVDPAYVLSVDSKPKNTFKQLKNSSWVGESSAVSTDVPFGQAPKRLRL